ncbi:unnamed protein product [Natator depressus]
MLHTIQFLTLVPHPNTTWWDLLPLNEGEEPHWASLYHTLVPWFTGDISWWLLHEAISTGVYLAQFTNSPDTCPFCSKREILAHIYIGCIRLQARFQLLQKLL